MKRKMTFRDKIRVFRMWMTEHADYALIATCSVCDSTRVRRGEYQEKDGIYKANYECMKCHATADVVENWTLPEAIDSTESA